MTQEFESFDFWYAVNNTEVLRTPSQRLETFGNTLINYRLITQQMDSTKINVREGRLEAGRPQIITPDNIGALPLEGFSQQQSEQYVNWIKQNAPQLRLIQYGFQIKKQEVKSYESSDPLQQVIDNVLKENNRIDDPLSAVLTGVDQPWEVCLLKLMVDIVEQSSAQNVNDFQTHNLLPRGPESQKKEIEDDFLMASRDHTRIPYLQKKLKQLGLFDQFQDRFFALVRASQR